MQTLDHKEYIGDFLNVLHMKPPLPAHIEGACVAQFGATARQEAVLSRYFGDLSLAHAADFSQSLSTLITVSVKLVVLDFSALRSFCNNAVAHLVNFAANTQGRVHFILYHPSKAVITPLQESRLDHLFTIIDTEEDLILALPDIPLE